MSITTRTGDGGQTSLYSGERVPKSHPRIQLVGSLDELNAHLGLAQQHNLQHQVFELGALVANTRAVTGTLSAAIEGAEQNIARLEAELPRLTRFILPGGNPAASHLHLARAVCRRAEQQATAIEGLPADLIVYLNRLSDLLFLLARQSNLADGNQEVFWEKS